jgi:predicted nucleic acid-binding protein
VSWSREASSAERQGIVPEGRQFMASEPDAQKRDRSALLAVILREEQSDEIRREALSYLLECELARRDEPSTAVDLRSGVLESLHLEYPEVRIRDALENLVRQGRASPHRDGAEVRYVIPSRTREALLAQLQRNADFFESVIAEWLESVRRKHPSIAAQEERILVEDVKHYLREWVEHQYGLKMAMLRPAAQPSWITVPSPDKTLGERWDGRSPELQAITRDALSEFFESPSRSREEYLQRLFENYIELLFQYIEGADDGSPLGVEHTEQLVLLDTNVVLAVLGYDLERQAVAEAMLEASQSVRATVAVSTRTQQEFIHLLDGADRLYRSMNGPESVRPEDAAAATTRKIDNVFIDAFLRQLANGSRETWGGFCSRARRVGDLLRERGVLLDSFAALSVDRERFAELVHLVGKLSPSKGPGTQEHDAHHYLVIRKWRLDVENPWASWFITFDRSLPFFDYEARETEKDQGIAFCMAPECWRTWLRNTAPARVPPGLVRGTAAIAFPLPFERPETNGAVIVRLLGTVRDSEDSADILLKAASSELLRREAIKAGDREQLAVEVDSRLTEVLTTIGEQLSGQRKADIQALVHQLSVKDAELSARDAEVEAAQQEAARQAALASEAAEAERIRKQQEEEEKKRGEQAKKLEAEKTRQLEDRLRSKSRQTAVAIAFGMSAAAFAFHFAFDWPDHLLALWALPCLVVVTYFLWKTRPTLAWVAMLVLAVTIVAPFILPRISLLQMSAEEELLWWSRISTGIQAAVLLLGIVQLIRRRSP